MYEVEPIIYRRARTEPVPFVETTDGNYLTHLLYEAGKPAGTPKMSIGVLGYRHIEDTRRCVESVLRFVGDIDYELILVDNGSQDNNETLDYFQSVPTERKRIIQVPDPLGPDYGSIFGTRLMYEYARGDIFVFLGNDNIITENALQNMIICLDSSPDIGLVTPMSSSAYMLQDPGLRYSTYEEMFAAAKAFNHSDPRKWQERMELATVATAVKREVLVQSGFYGYWTAEPDLCYRVRLAGYKTILLGDTWVCHNHDYATKTDTQAWLGNTDESKRRMDTMEKLSLKKRKGLKTFEDVMVFELQLLSLLEKPRSNNPKILAVNVTAGQPLLDVRNRLREFSVFSSRSTAFTTDAKYYPLLTTAADEVLCDRLQFLEEDLRGRRFGVILLGEAVNLLPDPAGTIRTLMGLLEPGGQLLLKLKNVCNVQLLQSLLEGSAASGDVRQTVMSLEDVKAVAGGCGCTGINGIRITGNYAPETVEAVTNALAQIQAAEDAAQMVERVLTTEYHIRITK